MRLIGNLFLFAGIVTSLIVIGKIFPLSIFRYFTWISHVFLYTNLAMWILLIIHDYFYTAVINPKNKAVLITGCDTGFGNAMAKLFNRRGYKVFACCLDKTSDGASELKETDSSNMVVIQMDVTDGESIARAVKTVNENLGKSELWAVVNNAGVFKGFLMELSTVNDYEMCFQVNALGMVRVTKAFLPMLRKSKGRVVNICSLAGRFRVTALGAYTMSKSAAVGFTEVLRQEMRAFGVRVISVEPEGFQTPMSSDGNVLKSINDSSSAVDEEVMAAYGKPHIEKMKKIIRYAAFNTSPNVERVYEAIEASVSLQNPADVYRPMRNFYLKIGLLAAERVPHVLLEISLSMLQSVMGLPIPKKGLPLLSRLLRAY